MALIRPARPTDAAVIADIYNAAIVEGGATFETTPRTSEDILHRIDRQSRFPIVVAEDSTGRVTGWAATSAYRSRPCYAGVAEFSFYVAGDVRGQGIGRDLLHALVDEARAAGFWKLVSRVFPSNAASRAACRRAGFRETGVYEKHGFGDGRWQDVVIVERLIPDNQTPTGLRFRIACEEDWPAIEGLLVNASLPLDGARQNLDAFVLAVREDTIVGCATVERSGEPAVLLRSVVLAASERGSGAGRALVSRTVERAIGRGAASVYLLTTTAEGFFRSLGFAHADREQVPPALLGSSEFRGACPTSAVVMHRALAARLPAI